MSFLNELQADSGAHYRACSIINNGDVSGQDWRRDLGLPETRLHLYRLLHELAIDYGPQLALGVGRVEGRDDLELRLASVDQVSLASGGRALGSGVRRAGRRERAVVQRVRVPHERLLERTSAAGLLGSLEACG